MIKRQYFISTINQNGNAVVHSYRQFFYKSWLPRPHLALNFIIAHIAIDNLINIDQLSVNSFNRC